MRMQRLRNLVSRNGGRGHRNDKRMESRLGYTDTTPVPPLRYFKLPSQRTPVHGSRVKPTNLATMPSDVMPNKMRPTRKSHGAKRVYRKKVAAGRRTRCRNEQRAKARR